MPKPQHSVPEGTVSQCLRLFLRGRWDPTALQSASTLALQGGLDWDILLQVAHGEALAPLLYEIVRDQDLVPSAIEQELRHAYHQNACRNTLLLDELGNVLRHLAVEGVKVILLKGAALAELVYGNIAVRPMSDLDLLIRLQDLPVTKQVLVALGYTPTHVEMHAGFNVKFRNEESFYKPGIVNTYVDLHWRLVSPSYYQRTLATEWFWETALPTQISGAPALVLGYEAQVLYLCSHLLLHHRGQGLLWLHDVAEAITLAQAKIDWEQILFRSQAYNLVLSVRQILTQVAEEWHVPIPTEVLERLHTLQPLRDEVQVFTCRTAKNPTMILNLFTDLVGTHDWLDKLHLTWKTLFPTRAYMQRRYRIVHPVLVPLYYPYRWLRGWQRLPGA